MKSRIPSFPAVMTGVAGLFMTLAGFGSVIPGFVKDRVPEQFVPIWTWVLNGLSDGGANERTVMTLSIASQWIIALAEWSAGIALLAATFMPAKRMVLTNFGVGMCAGLIGAFMLMMFAMHDYNLPRWNQYPAMLAWLGVIWTVVFLQSTHKPVV